LLERSEDRKNLKKQEKDLDTYEDDFDNEIPEDFQEDNNLLESNDQMPGARSLGNSGVGVTVSQSLGVDPSVDSLALEDYDHIEPVERLR